VVVVWADGTHRVVLLTGEGAPGLAAVGALARLQLAARRAGGQIRLAEVAPALGELLDLAGLRREVGGQAEGGEQVPGVEEGVDTGDAAG
jgi:hypothetical protein